MSMISPASLPCPGAPIAAAAFAQLPVLRTPRLILRAPKIEDFALYAELCASDRGRFLGGPMSMEEAWADFTNYTAGWLLRGDGVFTVAHNGELIGYIFAGVEPGDEAIELGFLFSADAEGRGLAYEAAAAVLGHLDDIGAHDVVSYIDPTNTRAQTLAKRLGALPTAHLDGSDVWSYAFDADGSPEAYA